MQHQLAGVGLVREVRAEHHGQPGFQTHEQRVEQRVLGLEVGEYRSFGHLRRPCDLRRGRANALRGHQFGGSVEDSVAFLFAERAGHGNE
ncbi:hypothetical protein V8017_09100 [Stenotrophomonas rhizophila]